MKSSTRLGRRKFLQRSTALVGAASFLPTTGDAGEPKAQPGAAVPRPPAGGKRSGPVWIVREADADPRLKLASRELARGLSKLGVSQEPAEATIPGGEPQAADTVFQLSVRAEGFHHPEAFEISSSGQGKRIQLTGATPQAVVYAVFEFLEKQGAFFGLDGEVYPLEPAATLNLPPENHPWMGQPRFNTRGLVPWPDFLNCVTVYNREDWRAYLEAMMRMRFNTLGVHVYSLANQWTESFLSFEYAGAGHLAYTDTSATNRWGYLPQRTSTFGMGGAGFFQDEVFGSEATTLARNCWEAQELAQGLWREAYKYAHELGIRTGVGFEPYQVPDEIYRAIPPEAQYVKKNPNDPGPRIDPESVAAHDILEARLTRLLEAYPMVDYVWLWEDEGMSWDSQKMNVPLSVTAFMQAYEFLKKHAPEKRLVLSGWGGFSRNFEQFHRELPEDIIFSSLNDNVGWDPVNEAYAKLGRRERWPIPWLEDDPAMWLPQFHVERWAEDMNRAEQFGCQGVLGIHWRHRIMDSNAGFQSRASWRKSLQPSDYFQEFAHAQVRGARATELGEVLTRADRDRLLLCTFTGEIKDGHHQIRGYAEDPGEAFEFYNGYEPPQAVKDSQAEVARQLRVLTDAAADSTERERLNYLTRHIEFLVPYSESFSLAFHLLQKLQEALKLKQADKKEEARQLILTQGVPLWLKMAPLVREAILDFQDIVSTRNDLGMLASIHNKYERVALFRLRASLKEFLGQLPPEVERAFEDAQRPADESAPRVIVPTRPSVLGKGERVRILAIVPVATPAKGVWLHVRPSGSQHWSATTMKLAGRKTFLAELAAPEGEAMRLDYYVDAEFPGIGTNLKVTAPLQAPAHAYTVTII